MAKPQKGVYPEHLKGKGFADNPGNINKKGARRTIGKIIDAMRKDDAGEELNKKTLMEMYKILFNTPKDELVKLNRRKDTPLAVNVIINTLLDPKTQAKAFHDYQQYVYGKATEEISITTKAPIEVDDEIKEVIMRKLANDY